MHRILGRRLLAGLAAVAAACTFATPANAAPAVSLKIAITPATVAAGGNTLVGPILYAGADVVLQKATMTYELGDGLTGVTLHNPAESGPGCTEVSPAKLTCVIDGSVYAGPGGAVGDYLVQIDAADAALGESGKLTATFTADGIAPVVQTTEVTVAEGVDLAAGDDKEISARPGAGFTASLQVHNTTEKVVHGAAIVFGTDYGFSAPAPTQFANCFYAGDELNSCTFDQELQPGVTYEVVLPYRLRPATYAPSTQTGEFEWLTTGDYDDLLKFVADNGFDGPGKAGAGAKLALRALPAKSSLAKQKQTDTDPDNNWQALTVNVGGKQGTDFAPAEVSLNGAAGETVTADVRVANLGPATLDRSRSGSPAVVAVVTIPDGTKVVGLPDACFTPDGDFLPTVKSKGHTRYLCFSDLVFPAKTSVTWSFKLRLDRTLVNATGWIEVNPACECDVFGKDVNKANDVAAIVINPRTGHAGAGGQGGSDGPGLPITGPQAGLFGGLGLLLVAAGVGGVVLARRRRTRFEV